MNRTTPDFEEEATPAGSARGWTPILGRLASSSIFIAAYLSLDWVSQFEPLLHVKITPWNPAPALGILFMFRRGFLGSAALFAALIAGDILVRNLSGTLPQMLVLNFLLCLGYTGIAKLLKHHCASGGMFDDSVSLLRWVTIVVVGTFANSLVFVSGLAMFDLIKDTDLPDALFRFWIGDAVGIFVAFPLLWWLQDFRRRTVFLATIASWESAGYIALSLVALWLAFVPNEAGQARYLYIVYLPLVWAAARHGVIGAVFCASLLQVGLLVAGWLWSGEGITAFELQMRSLLLAGVGFLIGVTVDERRRSEVELRQSLRLAAAGEMAAALAHELNQPLTALSAYGSAVERIIDRDGVSGQLRDVAVRMVSEAHRAADILHRLRDFFRTGATRLEVFPLDEVINTAIAPFAEKAQQQQIALLLGTIPSLQLHADRLQIEVVLRNLLSNAFDAVELQDSGSRRVSVDVACIGSDQIRIQVSDSGPGIDAALVERAFEPFVSSKSSGLGLGLAISRAIAEAHGGKLVASTGKGAEFSLFLPIKAIKVREHGRHRLHR